MRIGFFGGTFNPPHQGHLWIAEQVAQQYTLDKIYFCPSYISPNKQNASSLEANTRFRLVEMAVMDNSYFEPLDLELKRPEISYTIDTITQLYQRLRCQGLVLTDKIYLVLGSDLLKTLAKWKQAEKLLSLVHVISFARNGEEASYLSLLKARASIHIMSKVIVLPISSSLIRQRIQNGQSVRYLVPKLVEEYIQKHRLYQ